MRRRARQLFHLALWGATVACAAEPLGVTSEGGQTVFRVWAPRARSVEVVGDFNGWRASASERLRPDPTSGIWSVTLPRSRPEGAYRFVINGHLHRRDPYARAVSPDHRSSLFYDPHAFDWGSDRPPGWPIEDIVLYEMHVGTFYDPRPQDGQPATFYDAIQRLDYLKDLGVNVVLVMPVHEFHGNHSWGYNPCDLFAVEQSYGGPNGLKAFVKACHARGLAVHLDIVHNHYGPDHLDLYQFDGASGLYFFTQPELAETPWGPRVNFREPMVRRFIRDNVLMWLDEYRVDGFRWDSPSNIRSAQEGSILIPEGAQLLDDINSMIRSRYPHVVSIAEDSMDVGLFHASWDFEFHHQVMAVLAARTDAERDVGALRSALEWQPETMARVVYVDNHDEAGKINRRNRIANDVDPSNPSGERARRLCSLGAVLTFTAPGIPLLFMGNEFQETGPFHDDRPLDWTKTQRHAGLLRLHRDLIRLRRNLDGKGDALKGKGIRCPVVDRSRNVLVYWRWHEETPAQPMVVALNVSSSNLTHVEVPFPGSGPWRTLVDTEWAVYGGSARGAEGATIIPDRRTGASAMNFSPYSARIFGLAPGGTSPVDLEEAPLERSETRPPISLYSTLAVSASFETGERATWSMKLTREYVWEAVVSLESAGLLELQIVADNGALSWGAADEWPVTLPYRGTLVRRGRPLRVEGPLRGAYRVRFNEHTAELRIEPTDAISDSTAEYRMWTSVGGSRVQARYVGREGGDVVLEDPAGKRFRISAERLSAADRAYLRSLEATK